jgi:hypothetical protein
VLVISYKNNLAFSMTQPASGHSLASVLLAYNGC